MKQNIYSSNDNDADADDDDDAQQDANDPEDEIESQLWTYSVWIAAIPLLYYGYYKAAFCFIAIGLLYIFQSSFIQQKVPLIDQYKIKYNIYSPGDVINDLYTLQNKQNTDADDVNEERLLFRDVAIVAFTALAKKYNQILETQSKYQHQTFNSDVDTTARESRNQKYDDALQHLAIQYQDLIHTIVFVIPKPSAVNNATATTSMNDSNSISDTDDEVVSAALALLALISKKSSVRQRYHRIQGIEVLKETKSLQHPYYDFDDILHCIDAALLRAKEYDTEDETKDRIAAELQRKACLFIGAIADDTDNNDNKSNKNSIIQLSKQSLSIQIGEQGGIQTILNALAWYQYHVEVINWGLWSIFILCYDNTTNQMIFIQLDGIPVILQAMKNCFNDTDTQSAVVDVARHGTAILFDLLRESDREDNQNGNHPKIDRWKVRNVALSAGLHDCIVKAMTISIHHPQNRNMDIFVMGREILVGTNYQGSIPEPSMTLIPSSSLTS
jgi:hypothetical protein